MLVADLPEHRPGCHTERCDRWADRRWTELHRRPPASAGEYTASWFDDSEAVACSAHYALGFAHKSLPCGTRVTFTYRGHTAVGTVEDRGPFIAGRTFDLSPGLREALDCPDICHLRASVG